MGCIGSPTSILRVAVTQRDQPTITSRSSVPEGKRQTVPNEMVLAYLINVLRTLTGIFLKWSCKL
jgi:hypothetical protein